LKFGELVVIQGNYKILQLEYVKTLSISQFQHIPHVMAVLEKRSKEVKMPFQGIEVMIFSSSKHLLHCHAFCLQDKFR
jgi:hypothetical protein